MTLLRPNPVESDRFTYVANSNMFVAELSDFGPIGSEPFSRVYDDACDMGLTLINKGREIVFAVHHEERVDGDLAWIDLRPVNPKEWGAGTVRLYND